MGKYLVFRLYGPMAAWGEIAVGETRRSSSFPGKAAILGIIAAAIGIRRDEQDRLDNLTHGYQVAASVINPGFLLKDYHTVQVPDSIGKFSYSTRRDEIVVGGCRKDNRLKTILSSREYRCDALTLIAICPTLDAPYALPEILNALLRPKYVLYLGRKSCPLSLPLHPQIIETDGFHAALNRFSFPPIVETRDRKRDITGIFIPDRVVRYYWDGEAGDMQPQQTIERYERSLNRRRWQFAPMQVHVREERGA
ncbi:MAG: type I-E CRISPR-associated protein Cas5/CasD [Elusimicrobia bacterium RIFOXYB2_FULL_49_7]|nr:MAG: type I-E CRISPR-associated protein Cas5/CasD [Elusimicrobia bacterium RIFOXYB2_FULL_49_7]